METKSVKAVLKRFFITLIGFAFIVFILFNCYTIYVVWQSSLNLPEIPQQEYIRLIIYGSSSSPDGNTISAAFSIVDTNGNEIAKIERSWTGNYLGIEFSETNLNGKVFIFPKSIYGKDRIMQTKPAWKRMTSLEKFYNDNKQCLLLGFGSTFKERNELYKISRFAAKKPPVFTFGCVTSYSLDLSECKINRYYSIQRTASGKLIVAEL